MAYDSSEQSPESDSREAAAGNGGPEQDVEANHEEQVSRRL